MPALRCCALRTKSASMTSAAVLFEQRATGFPPTLPYHVGDGTRQRSPFFVSGATTAFPSASLKRTAGMSFPVFLCLMIVGTASDGIARVYCWRKTRGIETSFLERDASADALSRSHQPTPAKGTQGSIS